MQAHEHWEEVQARIVAEYIAAHGGRLAQEFAEVGSAAGKKERPIFKQVVQLCEETGAILIAAYFDRITRNYKDFRTLEKKGIKIVFCDGV